ncbi:MAG: tRNA uridine-5-carboxymethylaminomethyl(34) synthesis GTPase MnmE [Pseudomonadota bacterium]
MTATTIFALSSAPGRAGVAVFRVSGPDALATAQRLTRRNLPPREATLVTLRRPSDGITIDTALAILMPRPRSFTGEDCVEFHTHGGRAITRLMLETLSDEPGLRLAEPGEFALRAFHSGKLDLTEAEGLADLIDAETEAQRRQAIRQASGALSRLYDGWRELLLETLALTEAAIDFSDEGDVAGSAFAEARVRARRLADDLDRHLDDARRGEIVRDGFRVVLAGPVNAGKSTLLNWFAQRDAAIVSDEPGTTRDVIDVRLDLDGFPVTIADTAGLRSTSNSVELEGIRRSHARIDDADLVLWLTPVDQTEAPHAPAGAWIVRTKADTRYRTGDERIAISVHTGFGLDALTASLIAHIGERIGETADSEPVLTQARHRALVVRARQHIADFLDADPDMPELAAEDLRRGAYELGRLTGRIDPEDVLGAIFGRFCIGK